MNFLLNLNIREKLLLLVLGLVFIIFLGVNFLIIPAASAFSNDSVTLENANLKAEEANLEIAQAKAAPAKLKKAYEDASKSAALLLPSLDKPSLHLWINGLAQKSGLKISSLAISDTVAASLVNTSTTSSSNVIYNMKTYADTYKGKNSTIVTSSATTSSTTSSATSSTTSSTTSSAASGTSTVSGATAASSIPVADVVMSAVSLQMTGSYGQAKNFLDQLKGTKKCVVITSYTCAKSNDSFTCNATLQCYAAEKLDNSDHIFRWTKHAPAGKSALMK